MEFFPDGAHVRLRNREHRTYLHADEDGAGVSLRPHGRVPSSRNAVWRVRLVSLYRNTFILLQSTAYSSYLIVSSDPSPPGYGGRNMGRRVVIRDYDADRVRDYDPDGGEIDFDNGILWSATRAEEEGDDTRVFLSNRLFRLRAHGKHRLWHTGVTAYCVTVHWTHEDACSTPMMAQWEVEIIPPPAPTSGLHEKNNLPSNKEKIVENDTQWGQLEQDILSSPTKLSLELCSDVGKSACSVSDLMLQRSHTCLGCSRDSRNCVCDECTKPALTSGLHEKNNLPSNKEKIVKNDTQWGQLAQNILSSPTKSSLEVRSDFGSACSVSDLTLQRSHTCLGCTRDSRNYLCNKCTGRINRALLKARGASLGKGSFCLCLQCCDLVPIDHGGGGHNRDCIPLDTFAGLEVAWVTQKERWCGIFEGIQSDMHWNKFLGRPFLLYKPQGRQCDVCADHLSDDKLYGTLLKFCSIQCWSYEAEEAAEFGWLGTLMLADFDRPGDNYFCIVCRCVFTGEDYREHLHDQDKDDREQNEDDREHQNDQKFGALRVTTEFVGGTAATKVEIPTKHFMTNYWNCIKDLAGGETVSSPYHLFRLRDEAAQRCKGCKVRLEDGGGEVCSLECSLLEPMLPRQVKIQVKEVSESPGAQEPDV